MNNDGLHTTWLLSIMSEEVLSFTVATDNAHSLWKSIKSQLLPSRKVLGDLEQITRIWLLHPELVKTNQHNL